MLTFGANIFATMSNKCLVGLMSDNEKSSYDASVTSHNSYHTFSHYSRRFYVESQSKQDDSA